MNPTWIGYFAKTVMKFDIWMAFIFQFKSEPLGIKSRRELKENAIPTCLILLYFPKKGKHLLNNCKTKQLKK